MRIRTNRSYKYREIAGEYYLIPVAEAADKSKVPFQLTETAAWIWTQIETGINIEEIVVKMTEEFEVNLDVARNATESFIIFLLNQGILDNI